MLRSLVGSEMCIRDRVQGMHRGARRWSRNMAAGMAPGRGYSACCHVPDSTLHHHPPPSQVDKEYGFAIESVRAKFGPGTLREVGLDAAHLGMRRVAVISDPGVTVLPFYSELLEGIRAEGLEVAEYTDCLVEPTDGSFTMAAEWATDQAVDGYVSVGGGSVIDHAKAANLYATYPADFMEYVNKPLGKARGFGKLRPHIACPTTCGTGSEGTGYAICDIADLGVKTALAGRNLRPDLAVIDPRTVRSLPGSVLASSGFDVLSHAVESFTARRFDSRTVSNPPNARPLNQGANPYSDMGCREALRIIGKYFERALRDPSDHEAREQMHWAATLAGTAMGNAGTALPHG
eukprot:TRINITY_DN28349_c0_g2_i1.p1 TRINITY_DN28349_c0_g2~~TRINITY_DN28349_c0_g2_i1.p1  ORF type:complete len:379 (-),score=91.37 TRINITY_DN28349_c0_g2_i1:729-1772(-)